MARWLFFKCGITPVSFCFFVHFTSQLNYKLKKAHMLSLGFEPEAAIWQVQIVPLSYDGCLMVVCVNSRFNFSAWTSSRHETVDGRTRNSASGRAEESRWTNEYPDAALHNRHRLLLRVHSSQSKLA